MARIVTKATPAPLTDDDIGLLTVPEAAEAMGVRQGTVRVWIVRYGLATTRDRDNRVMVSERQLIECEYQRRCGTSTSARGADGRFLATT